MDLAIYDPEIHGAWVKTPCKINVLLVRKVFNVPHGFIISEEMYARMCATICRFGPALAILYFREDCGQLEECTCHYCADC